MCRSCEDICPAEVPYGELVDGFRGKVRTDRDFFSNKLKTGVVRKLLRGKQNIRLLNSLLRHYQSSWIRHFFKNIGVTRVLGSARIDAMLPAIKPLPKRKSVYPALNKEVGIVGLFTGCMGEIIDNETIDSAIHLLVKLGYRVILPEAQVCCGALDLHSGDKHNADKLFQTNLQTFNHYQLDAILSIASGCGAMLKEYFNLGDKGAEFSSKVRDINQFLVDSPRFEKFPLKPCHLKVYVHTPCSLKNVMHEEQGPYRLLNSISGVSQILQPQVIKCCGAAGNYMLEHPQTAKSFLVGLLDSIEEEKPGVVVSSNIGCAMHLRAGLLERGLNIEVLHPVVFVDRLVG